MWNYSKSTIGRPPRVTRRSVIVGAAAVSASSLLPGEGRTQSRPVKIGVILPLSGVNAPFGVNSRNGIDLVADEINAAGGIKALGGAKISLIVVDASSTPSTAATVAQDLIAQNEITAVLGAFASSLTIAVSEVTERRGILLLTMSFADQITGRGYKNVFQVVAKASAIGRAQFEYTLAIAQAAGEKLDQVAIVYEDTAYGTAQASGLRAAAKAAGIGLGVDEAYPLGVSDAMPLIGKLRASGAQAVFPVSYLKDSLLIIRTMRQQGITIPVIGGAAGYVIPDFEKGLGEFAEGVLSIAPVNYDYRPELTDPFRKRFGHFMPHEAIEHAVALDVLAQAIERAKSAEPKDVSLQLRGARFEGGWTRAMSEGAVQFDHAGLNELSVPVMVQWRRKELVTVWPKGAARGQAVWNGTI